MAFAARQKCNKVSAAGIREPISDAREHLMTIEYHLSELEIALDPTRVEHDLPSLLSARVGVVDVGCGIGQLFVAKSSEIADGVACFGFDIDAEAIAYATRHWPERASFAVCGAEKLSLPDRSVDFYVSRVALPYTGIQAALREAARVLVPGGRLWITLHPMSMTLRELRQAVLKLNVKGVAGRIVALLNGLLFHLFGSTPHLFGVRDSWQSVSRMKRELQRSFTDIRVTTGRYFLIEATRRIS
jgi:SAM-dependent methyltransferase